MSIWKMIYDLEYWIQIGIGDDIVRSAQSRPEFLPIVNQCRAEGIKVESIPAEVVVRLKREANLVWFKQPTFWRLVFLQIKKVFKR